MVQFGLQFGLLGAVDVVAGAVVDEGFRPGCGFEGGGGVSAVAALGRSVAATSGGADATGDGVAAGPGGSAGTTVGVDHDSAAEELGPAGSR